MRSGIVVKQIQCIKCKCATIIVNCSHCKELGSVHFPLLLEMFMYNSFGYVFSL